MPEIKNTFLAGKMNKSVDDRILPNGEYREAKNIQISKSDDSNVGVAHNIKGNSLAHTSLNLSSSYETIGSFFDERNDRIFWFVTDDTNSHIYLWVNGNSSASRIVTGSFLNFKKTNKITGVNLVENLLFFTDNLNQPRRINVEKAIEDNSFYDSEDKISVSKYAPYLAPDIVSKEYNANVSSKKIELEFVRFAYRYKFQDNEYSLISPFSQIVFEVGNQTEANNVMTYEQITESYESTENVIVVNRLNKITLRLHLPDTNPVDNHQISSIEILYKEADNEAIRVLDIIDVTEETFLNPYKDYIYNSDPFRSTLPENESTRVSDIVPKKALAQEFIGNRIIYGNITQGHDVPKIDYSVSYSEKIDISEYLQHSIKSRRSYEVGIILMDRYGRQSPVILSDNSTVTVNAKSSLFDSNSNNPGNNTNWNGDSLKMLFNEDITTTNSTTSGNTTSSNVVTISASNANIKKGQLVSGTGIVSNRVYVDKVSGTSITLSSPQTISNGIILTFTNTVVRDEYDATYNPLGWYSYKVVVKQNEQEYFNVYNPGLVSFGSRDYITLHNDNINKVPRDLTSSVETDSLFPSSVRLYPKLINVTDNVLGFSDGDGQILNNEGLIKVMSIGTLQEHGIYDPNDTFLSSNFYGRNEGKFYLVGHLEKETNRTQSGWSFPAPIGPSYTNYAPRLSVFETYPVISHLDIYYETSTSGLVSDLNDLNSHSNISNISYSAYGSGVFTQGSSNPTEISFPEDTRQGSYVASMRAIDTNSTLLPNATFTLQNVQFGVNSVTNNFQIVKDEEDQVYKIKTNSSFVNSSTPYVFSISSTFSGQTITSGSNNVETLNLLVSNVAPTVSIYDSSGTDEISTASAVKNNTETVVQAKGTNGSLSSPLTGLSASNFSISKQEVLSAGSSSTTSLGEITSSYPFQLDAASFDPSDASINIDSTSSLNSNYALGDKIRVTVEISDNGLTSTDFVDITVVGSSGSVGATLSYNSDTSAYGSASESCSNYASYPETRTVYVASGTWSDNGGQPIYGVDTLQKLAPSGWYTDGTSTGRWTKYSNTNGYWSVSVTSCAT